MLALKVFESKQVVNVEKSVSKMVLTLHLDLQRMPAIQN
jgi:hypothetical protein